MNRLPLLFLAGCKTSSPMASILEQTKMPDVPAATVEQAQIGQSLWPLSLVGGIAVLAGVIAMLFLPTRTGQKALFIGVVLCLIPTSFLFLCPELLKPVSQFVAVVSLTMLVFYFARIFDRKKVLKNA